MFSLEHYSLKVEWSKYCSLDGILSCKSVFSNTYFYFLIWKYQEISFFKIYIKFAINSAKIQACKLSLSSFQEHVISLFLKIFFATYDIAHLIYD